MGVGRSSASPAPRMGVLGDGFREGLGAKRCGKENVAKKMHASGGNQEEIVSVAFVFFFFF